MSGRKVLVTALFCCVCGHPNGITLAQTPAPPSPDPKASAGPPQPTEFCLSVAEVFGPIDELKGMTAGQLAERAKKDWKAVGVLMEFSGQTDLSKPARFQGETRIPVSRAKPRDGQGGHVVGTDRVGAMLLLHGKWKGDQADVKLKLTLRPTVPQGMAAKERKPAKPIGLERDIQIPAGKPVQFKFQDEPALVGEAAPDTGRMIIGTLTAAPVADGGVAADAVTRPGNEAGAEQALVEVEVFALDADREKFDPVKLDELVAGAPSGAELLRRLSAYGNAYQVGAFKTAFNLTAEQSLEAGARIPAVQDIHVSPTGAVTPSVTYEEVGAIFKTKPGRWQRAGDAWVADLIFELEASAIGQSGVKVAGDIHLPTFTMISFEGQRRFQSGRSEYFLHRGAPVPPNEKGIIAVTVARALLTRPSTP